MIAIGPEQSSSGDVVRRLGDQVDRVDRSTSGRRANESLGSSSCRALGLSP